MQDILLLIAASIGFAIVAIAAGIWFAGRQARRNPYSQHAFVRQSTPFDGSVASPASAPARARTRPAARGAAQASADEAPAAGQPARSQATTSTERDARTAAEAAVRDARDADADAVELEHRAAQAVRNARPNVSGSEAQAERLQERARRARRYATLATEWAADARQYADLSVGEPSGKHAALAIERAMQAAGARHETQRLANQRGSRVRGLQTAE